MQFSGGFCSDNLSNQAGNVMGSGAGATLAGGEMELTAANLQGTWTVDNGTALNLNTGASKFFTGATLTNNGTVAWNLGNVFLNGSAVSNTGLWEARSDNSINNYISASTFNNSGTFRKSGGSGTTVINTGFSNTATGTLNVQTGTIQLNQDFSNPGTVDVASGARFTVTGTSFANTGTLKGSGTIDPAAVLANSGIVQPGGGGTGQLTIDGAYLGTGSSLLDIQFGGLNDYDVLDILGNATWAGMLKVSSLGGYLPQVDDVFTVALFSGAGTGAFVLDASSMPRVTFQTLYDTHAIRLQVLSVSAVPVPPAVWLFGSGLLWLVGVARRKQPGGRSGK